MCWGVGTNQTRGGLRDGTVVTELRPPSAVGVEELHRGWGAAEGREGPMQCPSVPHAGGLPGEGEETETGCRVFRDHSAPDSAGPVPSFWQLLAASLLPNSQVWAAFLQLRWTREESPPETCQGCRRESWGLYGGELRAHCQQCPQSVKGCRLWQVEKSQL